MIVANLPRASIVSVKLFKVFGKFNFENVSPKTENQEDEGKNFNSTWFDSIRCFRLKKEFDGNVRWERLSENDRSIRNNMVDRQDVSQCTTIGRGKRKGWKKLLEMYVLWPCSRVAASSVIYGSIVPRSFKVVSIIKPEVIPSTEFKYPPTTVQFPA